MSWSLFLCLLSTVKLCIHSAFYSLVNLKHLIIWYNSFYMPSRAYHFQNQSLTHELLKTISEKLVFPNMWHDQGKWVACRQCSILSFQYNLLHIKSNIFIQTPLLSEIWFQRYEQIFEQCKTKEFVTVLAYNTISILETSDSFPCFCSLKIRFAVFIVVITCCC